MDRKLCSYKYLMGVILCSDKKGQVLRHNLPPPKSSPGWVRAQPAAPSGPGPQTLLSHQCWGSRAPKPPGPQAPQAPHARGTGQVLQMASQADWAAMRRQGRGEGPRCLKAGARPVVPQWGIRRTARHSLPPGPWAPRSPAGPRLDELAGPAEKAGVQLLPHCLSDDHCSTDLGWVSPLTVTHWQLLAWGRGPSQMAEWDWLPGNRVER